MDPKLKEVLDTLSNYNPFDFSVRDNGRELGMTITPMSKKQIVLKEDGTWDYK